MGRLRRPMAPSLLVGFRGEGSEFALGASLSQMPRFLAVTASAAHDEHSSEPVSPRGADLVGRDPLRLSAERAKPIGTTSDVSCRAKAPTIELQTRPIGVGYVRERTLGHLQRQDLVLPPPR